MINIYFIRHGQTTKNRLDRARQLSDRGIRQALQRRKTLENINFDIVVCSKADRTWHTANIVCNFKTDAINLNELYIPDGKNGDILLNAAERIPKPHTLRMFLEDTPEVYRALKQYAIRAWTALTNTLFSVVRSGSNVLVVGHTTLLQAIAHFAMTPGSKEDKLLVDEAINECEGFILRVEVRGSGYVVTGIEMIKNPDPALAPEPAPEQSS